MQWDRQSSREEAVLLRENASAQINFSPLSLIVV